MKTIPWKTALVAGGVSAAFVLAGTVPHTDFGLRIDNQLDALSYELFGIGKPLAAPAAPVPLPYRSPSHAASDQIILAKNLKAEYVTRQVANAADMISFWPDASSPTHLLLCIEGGRQVIGTWPDGSQKFNPSVQRVSLATGAVETLLRGMSTCDGIRTTPWATILATEETSDGGAYEILDPLGTTNHTVTSRSAGTVIAPDGTPSTAVRKQTALPVIAWEGIAILNSGVLIAGDELRPGSPRDADGGAIFKFIPAAPWDGHDIVNLAQSPFASGKVHAMVVSCVNNTQQTGQGCEIGNAAWQEVRAERARRDADSIGAAGFYRPEDLHQDPNFSDPADADAIRFCWASTGNSSSSNFAEVVCAVDNNPDSAFANRRTVVANRLVEGNARFNAFDNLDFQPKTRSLYVIEDDDNGEVIACLPDGADRDLKSDGCVAVASVIDPSAEPTGWIFTDDGKTAYMVVQHSSDNLMPSFDGYATDDLIKVTGFRVTKP